jgi:hypothetical protein
MRNRPHFNAKEAHKIMKFKTTISTRQELERQIDNCIARGKVSEARVSVACNKRIIKHDGQGVNGMYIDAVAVVVVDGQSEDLNCVGTPGK